MSTPDITPRNDNEGGIGSALKRWLTAFFGSINVTGDITDGTNTVTVAQLKTAVDGGGGGSSAVTSINGEVGDVVLDADDVGASAIGHNHDDAYDAIGVAATVQSNLDAHTGNTSNPHGVTAVQAGAIPASEKGNANGVAELDESGKVLSAQLPSYVDDVLEYASTASFPATGETGKIYIAQDTNITYRWSGSAYTEISASLALGETSSTAYRGDRGATAYAHSQITIDNPHNVTAEQAGAAPASHVGAGGTAHAEATTSVAGFMSAADKTKLDGVEASAEVNNISDADATTLTEGGNADALHTHSGSSAPTGAVMDFAGSSAPAGWLLCAGQAVSRTTYANLFSAISTTYGVGDGSTTFNVPDCRGRVTAGKDNMGGSAASRLTSGGSGVDGATLGATGGAETHQISVVEMPEHHHLVGYNASAVAGGAGDVVLRDYPASYGAVTSYAGGNEAHNNVQPTIVMNKIIKT